MKIHTRVKLIHNFYEWPFVDLHRMWLPQINEEGYIECISSDNQTLIVVFDSRPWLYHEIDYRHLRIL